MANKIEPANLQHSSFVDPASRYNRSDIVYYGDRRFITFETYKRVNYEPSSQDLFYVISKGTEFRPDLVSWKVYGSVSNWWRILEANRMKDVWEFRSGVNIIIPSIF